MHKPKYRINGLFLVVLLLSFLFVQGLNVSAQGQEVYVGGMPAGFTLGMGGAQVVGVCEVLTEDGTVCPARAAGMAVGDIITNYGGLTVRSAEDIGEALSARLNMGTFHSVFSRILRVEAGILGYASNFTIYDEADSRNLIKTIIKEIVVPNKLVNIVVK